MPSALAISPTQFDGRSTGRSRAIPSDTRCEQAARDYPDRTDG
jgi:hypothetical protein